jgi:DNA-binding transcriptional ArsR family regulator
MVMTAATADRDAFALDDIFQALSDPTRRGIVVRLTDGPATVSELAKPLPMSLASVMQHLSVLEQTGLVSTSKAGRVRTCRINHKGLRVAENWIADRRTAWEQRLDSLQALLEESQGG